MLNNPKAEHPYRAIYPPESYCLTPKAIARFEDKYIPVTETGCWLWVGSINGKGYGMFSNRTGSLVKAHRYSYTLYKGPIPADKVIDHKCRVRCCVNPDHLEAVSMRENFMRGEAPGAKWERHGVCKRGHLLEGDNLKIEKYKGRSSRRCRICRNMMALKVYHRRMARNIGDR